MRSVATSSLVIAAADAAPEAGTITAAAAAFASTATSTANCRCSTQGKAAPAAAAAGAALRRVAERQSDIVIVIRQRQQVLQGGLQIHAAGAVLLQAAASSCGRILGGYSAAESATSCGRLWGEDSATETAAETATGAAAATAELCAWLLPRHVLAGGRQPGISGRAADIHAGCCGSIVAGRVRRNEGADPQSRHSICLQWEAYWTAFSAGCSAGADATRLCSATMAAGHLHCNIKPAALLPPACTASQLSDT